jgi:predicted DsbA family dithiol-disulfide isomerase
LETLGSTTSEHPPVTIHWRSFELRPAGSPPISPQYLERIRQSRPQLLQIARERYGVEMNFSRLALAAAKVTESLGARNDFHRATMAAYWQQGLDISDRAVLAGIAAGIGLDRAEFLTNLDDPVFDRQVQADVDLAHSYGLSGVPALIFANKYLVSGAQPLEVLQRVLAKVAGEQE